MEELPRRRNTSYSILWPKGSSSPSAYSVLACPQGNGGSLFPLAALFDISSNRRKAACCEAKRVAAQIPAETSALGKG